MKKPDKITIDLNGVSDYDEGILLSFLEDYTDEIDIENNPKNSILIIEPNLLIVALEIMTYLEENCWKWEEGYDYLNTPKIPTWIGIDVESNFGLKHKYCIGINLENGTDVSALNSANIDNTWFIPYYDITVKYGQDKRVFDDNNNLIL